MPHPGEADVSRAVAAALSTASALGLTVDDAIALHASNRLTLRLLPADGLVRVAPAPQGGGQLKVVFFVPPACTGSRIGRLAPGVPPRVYERDGFMITLWTYYAAQPTAELSPAAYADALARLHHGMREV